LPFAFAVWVSRKDLPTEFVNLFNRSLQSGIDNLEINADLKSIPFSLKEKDLRAYFRNNIEYHLTPGIRISMKQFFDDFRELQID